MSKVTGHFTISHGSLEVLDALMATKNCANYGEFLDAATTYPKGTFTQEGAPVYDGLGCIIEIGYDSWLEADLEAGRGRITKRGSFRTVRELIQSVLAV